MKQLLSKSEQFKIHLGDCIPHMLEEMPENSVDFAVFSPPFPALYAYSDAAGDIGNVDRMDDEARVHLSFFFKGLLRVLKPGRVAICHICQIPKMKKNGETGLSDFRGTCIKLGHRAGFIYEYDWAISKNPQLQSIRNKVSEMAFTTSLERDRTRCRGAILDYLIKLKKPGENKVPVVNNEVTRNDWIRYAEGCWTDIIETDTLNTKAAKSEDDVRHICVARGQNVLTNRGYIPIEEVETTDLVLTHKGRWKRVLAKVCNGICETIATHAMGVPGLITTPDHKLYCKKGKGTHPRVYAKKQNPEWVEAKDTLGSYVNFKMPPTKKNHRSSDTWWFAGYWLGNGHVDTRGRLHLSVSYEKHDWLKSKIGELAGHSHDTGTAMQIAIRDPDGSLAIFISQFGNKATNKHVPIEALELEKDLAKVFLDGYLSADGHFCSQYNRSSASSVSRRLLLGMSIVSQRVTGRVSSVFPGRKARQHVIRGRSINAKQDWVMSNPPKNISSFIDEDGNWKKVRKINNAGLNEVWDLKIEDDESFIVEGCVVHNCPLQLEVIRRCVLMYSNPGEIVFSPFTGIGSEGFMSLGGVSPKTGNSIANPRRFYGCELKPEYFNQANKNLRSIASRKNEQVDLFDLSDECCDSCETADESEEINA